ncbi:MAG: SUMF1/EgtB/PvdO family nonheme iron enzyme [Candidatus Latescibacterota bacterium]|nr:SUMF1/EgtB/PvdO family nonheme iron enzyme [Candidatus Latescibacterota bacterium]
MKKQFVNILSLCIFSSFSHLEAIPYQISVVGTRGIHIDLIQNLVEKELNASSPFVIVEREKTDELISEMGFQQSGATKVNNGVEPGAMLNISHLFSLQTHRVQKDLHLSIQVIEIETGKIAHNYVEKVGYELKDIKENVRRLVKRIIARASLLTPVQMKKISGGAFSMGSDSGSNNELPIHTINIDDFLIDPYEVENIAFEEWLVSQNRKKMANEQNPMLPATNVSWHDASSYCFSRGARLPTEAEWEYVARGHNGRTYPWGEKVPSSTNVSFGKLTTNPLPTRSNVAGFTPEGIHHLAGNVAEWVSDLWRPNYNPEALETSFRVIRGGSWISQAHELRSSARSYHNPDRGTNYIGFRCARDSPQKNHTPKNKR